MTRKLLLGLITVGAVGLSPAPASANFWTNGCKVYGSHCYDIWTWWGEAGQYYGAAASFNVGRAYTTGARMQDEMWVGWADTSSYYTQKWGWIETGLTMGEQDVSTPYRFVAIKLPEPAPPGSDGFYEWVDWDHPQPMGVNINFTIQHEADNNWRVWWTNTPGGYDWYTVKTYSGFPWQFENVEIGLEAATFEAPINTASSTLGLIAGDAYHQATGNISAFMNPGVGLWARWANGEYGSSGQQSFAPTTASATADAPAVFSEQPAARARPTATTTTTTVRRRTKAWTGTVTSKEQRGSMTVYHGKFKSDSPAKRGEKAPSGTTMVEVRDSAGRVAERYIGEGEPNPQLMALTP